MKQNKLLLIFASFITLLNFTSCGSTDISNNANDNSEIKAEELGAKYIVPDVTKKTPIEAVEILEKTGFTNIRSNVTDKSELEAYDWIVVSQSVSAGTSLIYDKPISLQCKKQLHLYLDLKSEVNLIFSKYDIDVFVDNKYVGSVSNGENYTQLIDLLEGEHQLEFAKHGEKSLSSKKTINLTDNCSFQCSIAHSSNTIEIIEPTIINNTDSAALKVANVQMMVLSEGIEVLKDIGFINIKYYSTNDSIWDNNNWIITEQTPETDTIQDKNDEIKLKCMKLDNYFQREYAGKNVLEIEEKAKQNDFSVVYKDAEDHVNISSFVSTLSDTEKKNLVAESAIHGEGKQAIVYLVIVDDSETKDANESVNDLNGDLIFGKPYVQVRDYLVEKGYNAKYEHENTHLDFTGELTAYSDSELNAAGWIITDVKSVDVNSKQITLYVNTKENQQRLSEQEKLEQELEDNFPVYIAVGTLESYGKSQYPYGFNVKMLTGKLAETPIDNNTWFIKYKVEITDMFGNEDVYNCEAKIHGPADNPTVSDFYVY